MLKPRSPATDSPTIDSPTTDTISAARTSTARTVAGLFFLALALLWTVAAPALPPALSSSVLPTVLTDVLPVALGPPRAPLPKSAAHAPQPQTLLETPRLAPGDVAAMHSAALQFSPGWQVNAQGADPAEPDDPWQMPAGSVEFTYQGRELALLLAQGDYWGYLYITVDGAPANRLAHIPGNVDSQGRRAGYTTLYAPERLNPDDQTPVPAWHVVHVAATDPAIPDRAHEVRIELWRSWGQVPLRGVAVDALPPRTLPVWPALLFLLLGALCLQPLVHQLVRPQITRRLLPHFYTVAGWIRPSLQAWIVRPVRRRLPLPAPDAPGSSRLDPLTVALALLTLAGLAVLALASGQDRWWMSWLGLLLLGAVGVARPAFWVGALAFGLPFYFGTTLPLLPGRGFGLLDVGLGLGLAVIALHLWLVRAQPFTRVHQTNRETRVPTHAAATWLWLLVGWALVATAAAAYTDPAAYEWRSVFLAAGLFWVLLVAVLPQPAPGPLRTASAWENLWIVLGGWLLGATVMAAIALAQYWSDSMLITAEGVSRVRGLYGSPNNLALYLERTLLVSLGLALYLPRQTDSLARVALWSAALIQLGALLLTFSKGALLLALPVGFAVLWLGGLIMLPRLGSTRRPLWWLLGLAGLAALALVPFLGTERFRNLVDLSQGTGFLRLQLWRSAWAMALDHPWLGVGPDNFLYAFRSRYLLPAAWQEPNLNHPHNLLLDGWTRLGLPGLMLLGGWLATGIWGLWRGLRLALADSARGQTRRTPGVRLALAVALLAGAAAGLAHGLIDVSYALPDLMLAWVLIWQCGAWLSARSWQSPRPG